MPTAKVEFEYIPLDTAKAGEVFLNTDTARERVGQARKWPELLEPSNTATE
jgi:hypothetical protein